MEEKNLKGLFVDVDSREVREVLVEDSLGALYALINCDCIDIQVRPVGGVEYDVVLDDEGLLKSGAIVSAVSRQGPRHEKMVGNLLFVKHDGEGKLKSLEDADIKHIKENVCAYFDRDMVIRPAVRIW